MPRRVGMLSALLLAISLVSSSVIVPVRVRGEWPPPAAPGGPEFRPGLMRHDASASTLTPIDPVTLADAAGPVEVGPTLIAYADAWWCLASDGTTVATVEGEAIVVRDAASLTVRHRFSLGWQPYWCAISQNGDRLVVAILTDRQLSGSPLRWRTYDLQTGATISEIAGTHAGALEYWIDPTGHSLYQLAWAYPTGSPRDDGPKHPTLVAYDLDAGEARARLELPNVVAGGWWEAPEGSTEAGAGFPVMYSPAGVLLPDGKRFVVVHVGRDALTLVDTETMTLEQIASLARPAGLFDRLLGLLPLVPESAAAAAEGTSLIAALHPDGRHLYVTGHSWQPAGDGYHSPGLGLLLIDLDRGAIVAELPEGVGFYQLAPSSDGRSHYAIGPRPGDEAGSSFELRRLDATTLETLATRKLAPGSTLELIPDAVLATLDAAPARG